MRRVDLKEKEKRDHVCKKDETKPELQQICYLSRCCFEPITMGVESFVIHAVAFMSNLTPASTQQSTCAYIW